MTTARAFSPSQPKNIWPELPFREWSSTLDTLHRWMQIVGKIQLGLTPKVNHWWNVAFHASGRGLATDVIRYGDRWFVMDFDFIDHVLRIQMTNGDRREVALEPRSVASFYADTMAALTALGIDVTIWPMPVEIDDPIRFDRDVAHAAYDRRYVQRFAHIVDAVSEIMREFRAQFVGKASPVLFYWGTFDLAHSRFSGRRAPPIADISGIESEAYSHEVISVGWWPGDSRLERPAFYSYAAPEPAGFAELVLRDSLCEACYNPVLKGWYLDYDAFRGAADPRALLLEFFARTYAAAADLAGWDRAALERQGPR